MLMDVGIWSRHWGSVFDCWMFRLGLLGGCALKRVLKLLSTHLCPMERLAFVVTSRIFPGLCMGSTCKHQGWAKKASCKDMFLSRLFGSGTLTSISKMVSVMPEMGMVAREAKKLLFSQSKAWYSVCPIMVAILQREYCIGARFLWRIGE